MPTYSRFIFESFHLDPSSRVITLSYSLDDKIKFQETLTLPRELPFEPGHPDLQAALFALHLAGGASYYKTYCPAVIEVRSGQLTPAQAKFWNQLYTYGLGEFFFRNNIDFRGLINFPSAAGAPEPDAKPPDAPATPKRLLVPFGGGKDSIVTSELLRAASVGQTLFRLRGHRLITELADLAKLPLIEIDRRLAPKLFELNEAGATNGHVPITAYISFLSVVVSLLAGYDGVVFSNERSSSYGNVEYLGMQVNHQWSKSLESELMLRDYITKFITPGVQYLNIVRPLSELRIAQLFTGYPQYFPRATSCNRNWLLADRSPDAPRWCGICPKCAFSFALLAAFLPEATVSGIFGHNLFENPALLPLYRELWGVEGFKPFECVGTPEETAAAFYLARDKAGYRNTPVMKEFSERVLPTVKAPGDLVDELLKPDFNLVPPRVKEILKKAGTL